ncbi:MAG: hypothetical protein CL583_11410 [Alteromonadaceae bacterium]|nr:hypothetical protein [Alteromonadaceae bacterium]
MSTMMQWILILAGVVVCGALVLFIAGRLKKLNADRGQQTRRDRAQQDRRRDAIQSVRVIAMAVEQDQVDLAEASIRLHGLLQVLGPELLDQEPYRVFREMAEQTAHMHTHEARGQADRRDIRRQDNERLALEEQHQEKIRDAARAIRRHPL